MCSPNRPRAHGTPSSSTAAQNAWEVGEPPRHRRLERCSPSPPHVSRQRELADAEPAGPGRPGVKIHATALVFRSREPATFAAICFVVVSVSVPVTPEPNAEAVRISATRAPSSTATLRGRRYPPSARTLPWRPPFQACSPPWILTWIPASCSNRYRRLRRR